MSTLFMSTLRSGIADAFVLRQPWRRSYFVVGATALLLLILGCAAGFKIRAALPASASFTYSVATGLTLLACILYQWMLFFARLTGRVADGRRHYRAHRYVGAAALGLFALHAGAFGYAFVTVLALAFVVVAVTGLFNTEVLVLRKPWLRLAWEIAHIGIAGILMPLIALHVWAALAFK